MRSVKLGDVRLLSNNFIFADLCGKQLCVITDGGDLVQFGDREVAFDGGYV